MFLTSSVPDISEIFANGLKEGLISGAIVLLKYAWPYILFFIAIGILSALIRKKRRK